MATVPTVATVATAPTPEPPLQTEIVEGVGVMRGHVILSYGLFRKASFYDDSIMTQLSGYQV